jgi:hypothetical protein
MTCSLMLAWKLSPNASIVPLKVVFGAGLVAIATFVSSPSTSGFPSHTRRIPFVTVVEPLDARLRRCAAALEAVSGEDLLLRGVDVLDVCGAGHRAQADHGRLKSRLRPMRGLKTATSAQLVSSGHAFVQNLRRGHYELGLDAPRKRRLAQAFAELALVI